MEVVRKEVVLGPLFSSDDFARAFTEFRRMYNAAPLRVVCSPNVYTRLCVLYKRSADVALERSTRLAYAGIPVSVGILAPGTIALEGEVDEGRMGDW